MLLSYTSAQHATSIGIQYTNRILGVCRLVFLNSFTLGETNLKKTFTYLIFICCNDRTQMLMYIEQKLSVEEES